MRACLRSSSVIDELFILVTEEFPARYLASVLPWQIYIQENHIRHPSTFHRAWDYPKHDTCSVSIIVLPQKRIVPPVHRHEAVSSAASASPDGQSRTDEREKKPPPQNR